MRVGAPVVVYTAGASPAAPAAHVLHIPPAHRGGYVLKREEPQALPLEWPSLCTALLGTVIRYAGPLLDGTYRWCTVCTRHHNRKGGQAW